MVKIKVALIRFANETKNYVVPVSEIKFKIRGKNNSNDLQKFQPQDYDDFRRNQWYFIKWKCNDSQCDKGNDEHCHWWSANLVLRR